jgi:hypothetical protein
MRKKIRWICSSFLPKIIKENLSILGNISSSQRTPNEKQQAKRVEEKNIFKQKREP